MVGARIQGGPSVYWGRSVHLGRWAALETRAGRGAEVGAALLPLSRTLPCGHEGGPPVLCPGQCPGLGSQLEQQVPEGHPLRPLTQAQPGKQKASLGNRRSPCTSAHRPGLRRPDSLCNQESFFHILSHQNGETTGEVRASVETRSCPCLGCVTSGEAHGALPGADSSVSPPTNPPPPPHHAIRCPAASACLPQCARCWEHSAALHVAGFLLNEFDTSLTSVYSLKHVLEM